MRMKRIKQFLKKLFSEYEMRETDARWRAMGGSCFGSYPPSFYKRHTPEEIKEIQERDIKLLREMIAELDD